MHIGQLLTRAAQRHPTNTAWYDGARPVLYTEVELRVTCLADALRQLGLKTGDRVGMMLPNSPQALEVMFATMKAGLVIVPMNIRLHPEEHATILDDAGCSLLIYAAEFTQALASIRDRLPTLKTYVVVGDSPTADKRYEELLAMGSPVLGFQPGPEDLAWLFYTSGTTGKPKGVMLTHRNLLTLVSINLIDLNTPSHQDVLLHALAISFAGGFFMLHHVARAVTHVFLPRFDPATFFQLVEKHKVTTVALVPTMISMLVRSPARTAHNLSSLHTVFYGGAPLHAERLREALEAFGPIFLQSYGLGESPLTLTVLGKDEHTGFRAQSAGRVSTLVSLRIQDDDWNPVSMGLEGEIAVRSDLVMAGYWNRPEQTADVLKDGWFRTGDIGYLDQDGYLFISDRKKDLIKSGGATVSPREVEEVIHLHPAVQEVAVIGVPDETWGEAIKALVVLRPNAVTTEKELIAFCKDRLASFKKPRSVDFVPDLPKSANNKVLRRELRERYWQGRARKV
ncbi:long-chain-fatty-acid--CoA ligase [Hyalangium rubrum]|uniref:Long-chain-fatty-acid--CoA ligase n=1 Tax=Hyalangium rubrum TaxID=3103134 RepID=A0ABU5H3R4_9BACT|nr:long-chain-fatty-acid--CoA ligase [Hyalangium sp. s54d21]MDY7227767.1 long-chain-fatty-acid--CoA ligase [Hyalangium sp. s54d21]